MEEVLCYNRGCGQTYVPDEEDTTLDLKEGEGPCLFHPGVPYFHDGYKEWTCCNRKFTDFTEFLNLKGCSRGRHSRVKPVDPDNVTETSNLPKETVKQEVKEEVRAPISDGLAAVPRPPFDAPMTQVQPTVAKALRDQINLIVKEKESKPDKTNQDTGVNEIKVGEGCKNQGCKKEYQGPEDYLETCRYHPGAPIFHEGMKYWSCCQRKTSDFTNFLNQEGCNEGKHCWIKKEEGTEVKCRYDWHQTSTNVTVAIYGKKFDPDSSSININPVRLKAHLTFPETGGTFDLDLELAGIISCDKTKVSMLSSKVEIILVKAEPGSWSKLNLPREVRVEAQELQQKQQEQASSQVDALDLDDLELSSGGKFTLSPEASAQVD